MKKIKIYLFFIVVFAVSIYYINYINLKNSFPDIDVKNYKPIELSDYIELKKFNIIQKKGEGSDEFLTNDLEYKIDFTKKQTYEYNNINIIIKLDKSMLNYTSRSEDIFVNSTFNWDNEVKVFSTFCNTMLMDSKLLSVKDRNLIDNKIDTVYIELELNKHKERLIITNRSNKYLLYYILHKLSIWINIVSLILIIIGIINIIKKLTILMRNKYNVKQ